MNVIARDTTRGMPGYWPVIFTDTTTYKILKVPRLDHSGIDQHEILPDEEMFLKMKRFSTKNTIELTGDFWIGTSVYNPDNQTIHIESTTFFWENHEPPYHITNVRYKVLEGETWLEDTMSGSIPELFVIVEPNCPNVTGLTGTMDSLGNVDISWDSLDDQTKWVVHFTGPGVMETDTVTSCHKHYSGLYPNQAYSVKVNAQCYQSKYNIWSGWGETIWIGNTTGSIDEAAAFGFTLKPNPAMGKATVSSEGYDGAATVSVTTVDGIEVLRHDNTTLPLTLDLAGLASGVYMVRVGTARGTATKRLVVQ